MLKKLPKKLGSQQILNNILITICKCEQNKSVYSFMARTKVCVYHLFFSPTHSNIHAHQGFCTSVPTSFHGNVKLF